MFAITARIVASSSAAYLLRTSAWRFTPAPTATKPSGFAPDNSPRELEAVVDRLL
jgi:hypothetical protein